jgi:hypothetical protein
MGADCSPSPSRPAAAAAAAGGAVPPMRAGAAPCPLRGTPCRTIRWLRRPSPPRRIASYVRGRDACERDDHRLTVSLSLSLSRTFSLCLALSLACVCQRGRGCRGLTNGSGSSGPAPHLPASRGGRPAGLLVGGLSGCTWGTYRGRRARRTGRRFDATWAGGRSMASGESNTPAIEAYAVLSIHQRRGKMKT